jgi:nucleotide-binding universal stress UspA family protein
MAGLTALIPLDGTEFSESAFALLPLAKEMGVSRVQLISVWESAWEEKEHPEGRKEGEWHEVAEKGRNFLDAYLKERAEQVKGWGFEAEIVVRLGKPADEVVAYAESVDMDLVIIATHGRSGIARWRLGSVADVIVRHAPCPTLVIGPNVEVELAPYKLNRILVPLDGSALAETALPLAAWIARLSGAEVDLVRSISLAPVAYDDTMGGVYPIDLLTAMEDAARIYLDRMAGVVGGKVRTSLLIGGAGDQILEYLKESPADLVIMAAHGRAGVKRLVLGSVTDRVLHGPAPVLVLRPEAEAKSRLTEAAGGIAAT